MIHEKGALPAELIRRVFHQMLRGLAAAHEAGLIHRDIKPSNILLDRFPADTLSNSDEAGHEAASVNVKIADFGLARMASAQTRITQGDRSPGTPEYMSPEQARGDENIDHRTDLYSAGVVLYEMLTGRIPFKGDSPSVVIDQILRRQPPDPHTIADQASRQLGSLALRLMAKRPEDRFEATCEASAVLATGERVSSVEKQRQKYRRVLIGTVALVVVVGIVRLLGSQPQITRVWTTPDAGEEHLRRIIWADYDDGRMGQPIYDDFPREVGTVRQAELIDLDGDGSGDRVMAGTSEAMNGKCLFLLDLDGRVLWPESLTPARDYGWPDLEGPPTQWTFRMSWVANIDQKPGEEIIVVGGDRSNYPRRVSIVDGSTEAIRSTFWHMGSIDELLIIADFPYTHEDRRPAIVAAGVNNKLRGFGDPPPRPYTPGFGESMPRTEHQQVPIVMILDPENMEGLGPPRTGRVDLPPIAPRAYAFLDLCAVLESNHEDIKSYKATLGGLQRRLGPERSDPDVFIQVSVRRSEKEGHPIPWANIILTSELDLHTVFPDKRYPDPPPGSGSWEELWHPVIQLGHYITE